MPLLFVERPGASRTASELTGVPHAQPWPQARVASGTRPRYNRSRFPVAITDRTEKIRTLTADGLARLLARLHPDTERAALEYERLRRTLVRFFDWRGGWPPDECADEAIDRLARRLQDDTPVEDVRNYAHGIARMVLLERRRAPTLASLDADVPIAAPPPSDDDQEPVHECLERCLNELPGDGRALILDYYQGERSVKIANRRRLADALGLSENALRSRVQRLRNRLEACMDGCAGLRGEKA
jgi:DNA-directed RNA polymerase specialized sigma24 family protein